MAERFGGLPQEATGRQPTSESVGRNMETQEPSKDLAEILFEQIQEDVNAWNKSHPSEPKHSFKDDPRYISWFQLRNDNMAGDKLVTPDAVQIARAKIRSMSGDTGRLPSSRFTVGRDVQRHEYDAKGDFIKREQTQRDQLADDLNDLKISIQSLKANQQALSETFFLNFTRKNSLASQLKEIVGDIQMKAEVLKELKLPENLREELDAWMESFQDVLYLKKKEEKVTKTRYGLALAGIAKLVAACGSPTEMHHDVNTDRDIQQSAYVSTEFGEQQPIAESLPTPEPKEIPGIEPGQESSLTLPAEETVTSLSAQDLSGKKIEAGEPAEPKEEFKTFYPDDSVHSFADWRVSVLKKAGLVKGRLPSGEVPTTEEGFHVEEDTEATLVDIDGKELGKIKIEKGSYFWEQLGKSKIREIVQKADNYVGLKLKVVDTADEPEAEDVVNDESVKDEVAKPEHAHAHGTHVKHIEKAKIIVDSAKKMRKDLEETVAEIATVEKQNVALEEEVKLAEQAGDQKHAKIARTKLSKSKVHLSILNEKKVVLHDANLKKIAQIREVMSNKPVLNLLPDGKRAPDTMVGEPGIEEELSDLQNQLELAQQEKTKLDIKVMDKSADKKDIVAVNKIKAHIADLQTKIIAAKSDIEKLREFAIDMEMGVEKEMGIAPNGLTPIVRAEHGPKTVSIDSPGSALRDLIRNKEAFWGGLHKVDVDVNELINDEKKGVLYFLNLYEADLLKGIKSSDFLLADAEKVLKEVDEVLKSSGNAQQVTIDRVKALHAVINGYHGDHSGLVAMGQAKFDAETKDANLNKPEQIHEKVEIVKPLTKAEQKKADKIRIHNEQLKAKAELAHLHVGLGQAKIILDEIAKGHYVNWEDAETKMVVVDLGIKAVENSSIATSKLKTRAQELLKLRVQLEQNHRLSLNKKTRDFGETKHTKLFDNDITTGLPLKMRMDHGPVVDEPKLVDLPNNVTSDKARQSEVSDMKKLMELLPENLQNGLKASIKLSGELFNQDKTNTTNTDLFNMGVELQNLLAGAHTPEVIDVMLKKAEQISENLRVKAGAGQLVLSETQLHVLDKLDKALLDAKDFMLINKIY